MELLTAAFVTGTLLISLEGEGAGLALIAGAIAIVAYQTGGWEGVVGTINGMGPFAALILSPCFVVLSWRAMRKWLPARVRKSPTTQQETEGRREAAKGRQDARQQDAERRQQEAEMRREAARQRQRARQEYAERQRQAEREREQQRQAERQWEAERRRTAQQKPLNWWDLLGVSPNASMEEIARSYRRTIQKYHPDRVLGLAPEFLELAENRTKALNAAYDQAKRSLLMST